MDNQESFEISGRVVERLITTEEGNNYLYIVITHGAEGSTWVCCNKSLAEGSEFTGTFKRVSRTEEVDRGSFNQLIIADEDEAEVDNSHQFQTKVSHSDNLII